MFDEDFVAISDTDIAGRGGQKKLGQTEAKVPQLSISQSAGSEVETDCVLPRKSAPIKIPHLQYIAHLTCNTSPTSPQYIAQHFRESVAITFASTALDCFACSPHIFIAQYRS